jgi:myo-inositol-1(or 4)-monophosphatase
VAIQAVKEAGNVIMAHFPGEKRISYKEGRSNIVTDVDLLSEEKITTLLQYEYPDFSIMTEESADIAGDSPYTWIIDPIDGTRNYAYGIPHFCVALALARDDELILGIVYDPVRGELFRAEKGNGAFLNDSPISVSTKTSLKESLIGFDMGYDADIGQEILGMASALWPEVVSVRVMGSAALALAYTACSRLDLYIHLYLYPWDLASGMLLIEEAGGMVTGLDGQRADIHSSTVIATNREIHQDFMKRIRH